MHTGFEQNEDVKNIQELIRFKDFDKALLKIFDLKKKYLSNFFLENLHGVILAARGEFKEALKKFEEVIKLEPNFIDSYYNLANIFLKIEEFDKAVIFYCKTLEKDNKFYNAYFNLANCYEKLNQIDNSIKYYNLYIQNVPDDLSAYINLGIIFFNKKNFLIAKNIFNKALNIDLSSVAANFYIGLIFLEEKKLSISIDFFRKTIYSDKNFYLAYVKLAEALILNARFREAAEVYTDFFKINSTNKEELADCHYRLGDLQGICGELESAFSNYDLGIFYSYPNPKNIGYIKNYIFYYNSYEKFDQKKYFELINIYLSVLNIKQISLDAKKYKKIKKIRIGFLSADLREHAVGFQIIGILEKLSLDKDFEICFYNLDKSNNLNDKITSRFKILSSFWFDIDQCNANELANKIYNDEIKILFDLGGYTRNNLLEVFLFKPAPIQISWAGYLASTGIQTIDYIIADPYVVSKNFSNYFKEKPLLLNNSWSILTVFDDINISNQLPLLKNKYLTFSSFNSINKINKNMIKIWSKILNSITNSKLKLISYAFNDENIKKNFKQLFFLNGVKDEQLILLSNLPREKLLKHYNDIDIALDTFPYNGGTTSMDAIWMAVPLLTKFEDTFLSRCGKSINSNLGLTDWICKTEDEYVEKAIKFANDPNFLKKTKDYLLENKRKLFDVDSFAKNFSFLLKKVWHEYSNNNCN